MADYRAFVVIEHPTGEKSHTLSASSMRALKHKIYLLSFDDVAGENDKAMNQWRTENAIKPVRTKK